MDLFVELGIGEAMIMRHSVGITEYQAELHLNSIINLSDNYKQPKKFCSWKKTATFVSNTLDDIL